MEVFWALIVCVAPLVLVWYLRWTRQPSLSNLPRKKGWPFLGNLLDVDLQRPEITFMKWRKDLGNVFVVNLMNQRFVILNSFEAIYEALVTNGNSFAGRPMAAFRLDYLSHGCQDLALANPDLRWKFMKQICQRELKMYGPKVKEFEELTLSMISKLVENFYHHDGQPFNPKDDIYSTVTNIMTSLLVSKQYTNDDKEIQLCKELDELVRKSMTLAGTGIELDIFPSLRFLWNPTFKLMQRLRYCQDELWRLMKEASQKDSSRKGLVPVLLQLMSDQQNGRGNCDFEINDTHLKMICFDNISGGVITTTSSFYSYLNIMCHYPEVHQKICSEVARVVGPIKSVSLEDRSNMPYTQAVLLELLRFTSVGPFAAPHMTLTDTSVCGYPIPKGVQVLVNLWALHHDEDFWEAPYEFKPERFLDDEGSLVSASHENRRHLMPFGAGPRTCMGEVFAVRRLFLMMASIAQAFEIQFGPVKVSCDPREYESGAAICQKEYKIRMVPCQ